jgi:uncharacterized DUF497 family protein
MEFEFDPRKSLTNRAKHGIDFHDAQQLWDDPSVMEIPARTEDEPRWLLVGRTGEQCWSAVVTERAGRVRIISVRRARKEEIAIYEG